MRILLLHQSVYERNSYDVAIDHSVHHVVYAGSSEYIENIPAHITCEKFIWDDSGPVELQLQAWMTSQPSFDRIITSHECLILPAALLREKFGVPGIKPDIAINFRDKVSMKRVLEKAGIRVPRFMTAAAAKHCIEPVWWGKTIVKPRDGVCSYGVKLFNSFEDAQKFIAAKPFERDGLVEEGSELEEYLEGPIWHVDGFMFQGKIIAMQSSYYIGNCMAFQNDGKPLGSVQFDNPELEAWAVRCLKELGAETMTFHLEAIMTDDGPAFLEVAARCGGAYVADTFKLRRGISLHTLGMASDVDDKLAVRFINDVPKKEMFGWFVYPAHVYGGASCKVNVSATTLSDPCFVSYKILSPNVSTTKEGTFRAESLPFSGIISGHDSNAIDEWIRRLMIEVTVEAVPE